MECFKRFRNIDSHFASKQILKDFERSNHRRVSSITSIIIIIITNVNWTSEGSTYLQCTTNHKAIHNILY